LKPGFLISLLLAFLLLCFSTGLLSASEAVDLGEVVVEGRQEKEARPSLDSTASSAVLIPEEKKDEIETLSDLLEQSAGVHVRRYGAVDDFSALSLRGSSAGQVQIYLDDIPLTSAQGSIMDLGIIPLEAIEKAEVYRGGSPGSLPESAIGGVVLLKSRTKPSKRNTYGSLILASFETIKGKAGHTYPGRVVSPVLAFEHDQSRGNFLYNDDNGTRFNTRDDRLLRRQNNDFASNSLFTKFVFDLPSDANISFTNVFFQKDEGIPGLGARKSLHARLATWRELASVVLEKKGLFTKNLFGHADFFFDYTNSRFSDPASEIGLAPQDNDDKTYRFGINLKTNYNWGIHQQLTLFVANRSEFYCPYDRLAAPQHKPQSSRYSINAGLQDEIRFLKDRLTVVPSVRVENLINRGALPVGSSHQLSAKLGISARLIDELYFKANVYRGFRNPTFSELFGDRGTLQGNPNLKAEKGFNLDAGLSYDFPSSSWFNSGRIEAAYFRNYVDGLIQFVQTSAFTAKAMNLNDAVISGVEAMASAKFAKRFKLSASYTFQMAKDHSDNPDTRGKYLPGRPIHELYSYAGWQEHWLSWLESNLFCDLRYMSGNYLDTQNLLKVSNRTLLGSGVSLKFIGKISAAFLVQNILNDMISDFIGYPLPGRSYWATIEVKI
jgi:iron complex outermembrane receptor protein